MANFLKLFKLELEFRFLHILRELAVSTNNGSSRDYTQYGIVMRYSHECRRSKAWLKMVRRAFNGGSRTYSADCQARHARILREAAKRKASGR